MKKILAGAVLCSSFAFSQVGINTDQPSATLDVVASASDLSKTDGIIAPRLTGNQLRAKNNLYTAAQDGTIVYITAADSSPSGKTANVTAIGYYYFDKTLNNNAGQWVKLVSVNTLPANTNIYNTNGSLSGTRIVNQEGNSLVFRNATNLNAFSVLTGDTRNTAIFAVDGVNSRVGIGTPDPTNKLHINSGSQPGFRLVDGTQAAGRVLTSNATGVATWQSLPNFDATDDAFVNDAANNMVKLGTRSNGTSSRPAGTDFVITDNGRLGIGTSFPDNNLHVTGGITVGDNNATQTRFTDSRLQFHNAAGTQIANISVGEFIGGTVMNINSLSSNVTHTRLNINKGNVSIGRISEEIPTERLIVDGAVRISHGGYSGITEGATTPVPTGGTGTIIYSNGSFWGYTASGWKKLHT